MIERTDDSTQVEAILNFLLSSIENLEGVGKKTAALLCMASYNRIIDILFSVPRRYIERRFVRHLGDFTEGAHVIANVRIVEHRQRGDTLRVTADLHGIIIILIFFRQKSCFMQNVLTVGHCKVVSGVLSRYGHTWQMTHPNIDAAELGPYEPVYASVTGISSKILHKYALQSLKLMNDIGKLPEWHSNNKWPDFAESLRILHNPRSAADIKLIDSCRSRLAFDEIMAQQIATRTMRAAKLGASGKIICGNGKLLSVLRERIGFQLTGDQERAIQEIANDQSSDRRMFRMLMGDVGSGKTIVALFAMLRAVETGYQAVLLVPTEILAHQHYQKIKALLPEGVNIALLTSKVAAAQRRTIESRITSGDTNIIVGTHAVFQEKIQYANLGLAVIDEQHRFGVAHRQIMANKCINADSLFMSATPIPRSILMLKYNYLDCSVLNEKPSVRGEITTVIIPIERVDSVMERLGSNTAKKTFWVCPLIDESEVLDLASANQRFLQLSSIFGNKVGMVHGGIPNEERIQTIADFTNNKLSILVATTVIEVGIDVPDADIMIIEDAQRFGLSQLHQLRGRVARGISHGTCVLLYRNTDQNTLKRLAVVRDNTDGFLIAEQDLRIRGGGDITGYRQSGRYDKLFFDPEKHGELVQLANQCARDGSILHPEIPLRLFEKTITID